MKPSNLLVIACMALGLVTLAPLAQPTAPKIEDVAVAPTRLTIRSDLGVTNVIEYTGALATNPWLVLTNLVVTNSPYVVVDLAVSAAQRFYRVVIPVVTNVPVGMALIPAGAFQMGDLFNDWPPAWGTNPEIPVHTVYVSAFYMDRTEVTKGLWDEVYNWAVTHGYSFDHPGSYYDGALHSKGPNHPVHSIKWYDAVKWCNARSEKEGRAPAYYTSAGQTAVYRSGQINVQNDWVKWGTGYRLPTEAEWEKAARGGASGRRFPWSDTDEITHIRANYYRYWDNGHPYYAYDTSATRGYHPTFNDGVYPYTSPVGYFAANGYGLYDMAGNVGEWCWDWYRSYSSASQTDPRGPPVSGSNRMNRGGSWYGYAFYCRAADRNYVSPTIRSDRIGFRSVLPPGQ